MSVAGAIKVLRWEQGSWFIALSSGLYNKTTKQAVLVQLGFLLRLAVISLCRVCNVSSSTGTYYQCPVFPSHKKKDGSVAVTVFSMVRCTPSRQCIGDTWLMASVPDSCSWGQQEAAGMDCVAPITRCSSRCRCRSHCRCSSLHQVQLPLQVQLCTLCPEQGEG